MTQSSAILRYVGKLAGLYPEDSFKALEVDAALNILDDMLSGIVTSMMGPKKMLLSDDKDSWTTEEKKAIREKWLVTSVPSFLGHIEKKLEESQSGWIVGDTITIADLRLFCDLSWFTSGIVDDVPTTMLDDYPACAALLKKVKASEDVKKWTDKYSKPYGNFDYVP